MGRPKKENELEKIKYTISGRMEYKIFIHKRNFNGAGQK